MRGPRSGTRTSSRVPEGPSEGGTPTDLSGGPSDRHQTPPIGGQLQLYADQWEETTTDAWVQNTIHYGFTLEFLLQPPRAIIHCPIPKSPLKLQMMQAEINHLLEIAAIEQVPGGQEGRGFTRSSSWYQRHREESEQYWFSRSSTSTWHTGASRCSLFKPS